MHIDLCSSLLIHTIHIEINTHFMYRLFIWINPHYIYIWVVYPHHIEDYQYRNINPINPPLGSPLLSAIGLASGNGSPGFGAGNA